jgi:hypothetical protein
MMRIACGVAVIVALWGGAAASGAEPIPLRAGPLTLVFEPDRTSHAGASLDDGG